MESAGALSAFCHFPTVPASTVNHVVSIHLSAHLCDVCLRMMIDAPREQSRSLVLDGDH
jgi:hypothetical protein